MKDLSSIVGLPVIATDEGKQLGTVSQALVDLSAGRLVAVVLGRPPGKKTVLANDIESIGRDALMVSTSDKARALNTSQELGGLADVLESQPPVVTDQGTSLGRLAAVYLDPQTMAVTRYEVTGGVLRDALAGAVSLSVIEGTVHGQDTIIVPHDAAKEHVAATRGGLKGQLERIARVFQAQYKQASERTGELCHEGGEKLKAGAEKARQAASTLTDEARQKLREAAEKPGDQPEHEGSGKAAEQETKRPRRKTPAKKSQTKPTKRE